MGGSPASRHSAAAPAATPLFPCSRPRAAAAAMARGPGDGGGGTGAATCAGDTGGANAGDPMAGTGGGGGGGYDGTGHGCGGGGAAGARSFGANGIATTDSRGAGGGGGGGASYFASNDDRRAAARFPVAAPMVTSPLSYFSAYPAGLGFACNGSSGTYTVPAGVTSLRIYATGGAGAPATANGSDGAAGASLSGTVPVSASSVLNVTAGCARQERQHRDLRGAHRGRRCGGVGYYAGGAGGRTTRSSTDASALGGGGGGGATGIGTPATTCWWRPAGAAGAVASRDIRAARAAPGTSAAVPPQSIRSAAAHSAATAPTPVARRGCRRRIRGRWWRWRWRRGRRRWRRRDACPAAPIRVAHLVSKARCTVRTPATVVAAVAVAISATRAPRTPDSPASTPRCRCGSSRCGASRAAPSSSATQCYDPRPPQYAAPRVRSQRA